MNIDDKILVTGSRGLVGSALVKELNDLGYDNIVGCGSRDCDLTDFNATKDFFAEAKPDYVFHLAASVHGIMGNMCNKGLSYLDNVLINTHVIEASRLVDVKKIVAMGSGCVYPYPPPSLPLKEEMIWQGEPHSSEDSYAHAKRAMFAQLNAYKESYDMDFSFVISGNLYGPHDKFDIEYGHVTPSLVRKFYEAKKNGGKVVVWGDGSARRDFLYSGDVAKALVVIMDKIEGAVNMGSGVVNSIKDIVDYLADYLDLKDMIDWDRAKPNGQDYRAYDIDKLFDAGFKPEVSLQEGIKKTYDWYANNVDIARK